MDKANSLETCPMCMTTFDTEKYQLVHCGKCGAEGSTACCVDRRYPGGDDDGVLCFDCEDAP